MESENTATSLRVASFACYLDTADNNFVHKIKKALEDPMPSGIVPPQETTLPMSSARAKSAIVKASINNHISQSPRVASFAHYLDTAEENFAFKASGPAQKMPGATSNLEIPKSKDGEIDIFGADKYFNMKLENEKPRREHFVDRSADLPGTKPNFGPPTPSVSSEASSWNSQTALLRNLQGNASQVKQKKALARRFLTSFACSGPCLDKKSVYVDRGVDEDVVYGTKHIQQGSRTNSDRFQTHVVNPKTENSSMVKTGLEEKVKVLEDPRQSIEVFGCKTMKKGDIIPANLERKVSTLTWDAIPKAHNLAPPTVNSSTICDDMASDASSDLFEIENISGSGYGLLSTQEPDNMSCCMSPTTLYAPSEVSIEWSVITASAADFSSVISDYEERSLSMAGDFLLKDHSKIEKANTLAVGKGAPKSRPGGLLGCNSQKAVNVAETTTVHKTTEKAKHQVMDSYVSLGKLQASAKVKDVESIQSQQSFTPRRLPASLLN